MQKFIFISVGAILGANLRYWIADWAAKKFGSGFPYGTMIINFTGSLLLGFFMTLAAERLLVDPKLRLLVTIGFLGSYTTFSTFSYESINLFLKGQLLAGLLNLFGSAFLGLAAVVIGIFLAKSL